MHGLAVNLIFSVSGHPWIINEIGVAKCTFDVVIVSITTKPYILQKNFESMNLLQMSCVITWAQKKIQPPTSKKKAVF